MTLTDKQQRFIDEYCIDQTASAAYKRAGYKVKTDRAAESAGSRLYANPVIRAEIDTRLAALAKRTRMTAEESWLESRWIATSNIADSLDITGVNPRLKPANEIPESAWKAMKSVKLKRYTEGTGDDARDVELVEITLWDKPGQINTNLRSLGQLNDKVEHSGPGGAAIPLHHTGNVTHDPTLQAADAAYAESLADSVLDSVTPAGEDSAPNGGIHPDGGPQSVDHGRDPDHAGNADRQPTPP